MHAVGVFLKFRRGDVSSHAMSRVRVVFSFWGGCRSVGS